MPIHDGYAICLRYGEIGFRFYGLRTRQPNELAPPTGYVRKTMNTQIDPKGSAQKASTQTETAAGMMYVKLFHGRKDPKMIMNDWGGQGPIFGPYLRVQITYAQGIQMEKTDGEFNDVYWNDDFLIYYDGIYYGDMTVFISKEQPDTERLREFDKKKTR